MLRMSGVTTMSDVEERTHSRGDLLSIASVSHDASGMNERQRERERREREERERERIERGKREPHRLLWRIGACLLTASLCVAKEEEM
jgi:hypothetical protein